MGGFYQDLRKHEGAVPARVNEVLALLYGGEHLAAWTYIDLSLNHNLTPQ